MGELRFHVLGPLAVERDGSPLDIGGTKQRTLLAAMLVTPNQVVAVERLVELLWGDGANERSKATLHVSVAKLRRALSSGTADRADEDTGPPGPGRGPLETVAPGYRLAVTEHTHDLLRFHAATNAAREASSRGDLDGATSRYTEALALPRGPLLADLATEPFVEHEAQVFARTLATVRAEAFEVELRCGRHAEVVAPLERAVHADPLDERFCGLLMVALYRSGRQSEALAAARRLRAELNDELGIEPSPRIARLERQVLQHDAALADGDRRVEVGEEPATLSRPSRTATTATVVLAGERIPLTRAVTTIGRRADRSIVIADQDASRRHAEIRRSGGTFVLVDVGSTNGTRVNGARVSEHALEAGDEIEIGSTTLAFER